MATLTVQDLTKAGLADLPGALAAAAGGGDDVPHQAGLMIVMANGDASPHTLTLTAPESVLDNPIWGDLDIDDLTLVVAAGGLGVLTVPSGFAVSNALSWTYDDVTSVTVGVFRINP